MAKPLQLISFQLRSLLCIETLVFSPVEHILYLSDVNECEDPAVCGTAQCQNKEGSYDCLCDVGYVYDNETKTCVGKFGLTHSAVHTKAHKHSLITAG